MPGKAKQFGPYSSPKAIVKLDRRTKPGMHFQAIVADLTKHVGGQPNPVQQALIQRAAWLSVRVAVFDKRFASTREMTERETNTYLAWSNTLARTIRMLGLKDVASKPASIADYIASKKRSRSTDAREPAA